MELRKVAGMLVSYVGTESPSDFARRNSAPVGVESLVFQGVPCRVLHIPYSGHPSNNAQASCLRCHTLKAKLVSQTPWVCCQKQIVQEYKANQEKKKRKKKIQTNKFANCMQEK